MNFRGLKKGTDVRIKIGSKTVRGKVISTYKEYMTVRVDGYSVQTVFYDEFIELVSN